MSGAPGPFISVDWGTSSLRLRWIALSPFRILAEARGDEGAASIQARAEATGADRAGLFEEVLRSRLEALRAAVPRKEEAGHRLAFASLPVVISGMASSSIGWVELPYAALPFRLDGSDLVARELRLGLASGHHTVHILSGVSAEADILRGEETELLGIFADPARAPLADDALVILPGTHSKHARIRDGRMSRFETHLSGELLEVLRRESILRHHVLPPPADVLDGSQPSLDALRQGVSEGAAEPLASALFRVRARSILECRGRAWATAYLAGILLGAELAAARAEASGATLVLAASGRHRAAYVQGLETLGLLEMAVIIDSDEAELAAARGHAVYLARLGSSAPGGCA